MATKSILKEVRFKDKGLCRGFVRALENASGKHSKDVIIGKSCEYIKPDKIKKFFGDE